jgi:tetratricopeptide (TPR) repeat protein
MAMMPLLNRLGSIFQRKRAESQPQASTATTSSTVDMGAPAATGSAPASGAASGALSDPIVAAANQELAAAQAQPVPTEEEQLVAEQHPAWAAYDFERCIVIFSRLLQMHPDSAEYKEKLVTSYFNRGKQYEDQGNEERASQLYYSALSIDPDFGPAREAAEAFANRVENG